MSNRHRQFFCCICILWLSCSIGLHHWFQNFYQWHNVNNLPFCFLFFQVMSCQQIIDYRYKNQTSKRVWNSQCISGCERTIARKVRNYDDTSYNDVMVECKNGEVYSVMCSIMYARGDHDLSGKPAGWKQFKKTVQVQQQKKLFSMVNQVERLQSFRMVQSVCASFRSNVLSNTCLNLNDAVATVYGKKILSPELIISNKKQKMMINTRKHKGVTNWIQHDVGSYDVSNVVYRCIASSKYVYWI